MNPFEFLDDFFIPKTRVIGLSVSEDFVILACVVFTQCQRVTDGRTDGQTDRQTDMPIVASTGLAATLTPCKNRARYGWFKLTTNRIPHIASTMVT